MGMALSGLASGFDWKSIVDQLIEVSRAPQTRMRREQTTNSQKSNALEDVRGKLAALKTSISNLNSQDSLLKKSAAIADKNSNWTATATKDTPAGDYNVEIISQATATVFKGRPDIGAQIKTTDLVSSSWLGATITADSNGDATFTINGTPITFKPASETWANVFTKIQNAGITVSSWNGGPSLTDDVVSLTSSSGPLTLGAATDTTNFLQVLRLYSNGTSNVKSSTEASSQQGASAHGLGLVRLDVPMSVSSNGSVITSQSAANFATSGQGGMTAPATGSNGVGSFKVNNVDINYDTKTDSIQSILDKITASSAGVSASYDRKLDQVILQNKKPGNTAINVISGASDASGIADILGLIPATFNINGRNMSASGTINQTVGQNATFRINGGGILQAQSSTLTETDHGIKGLTINANSLSPASSSVPVTSIPTFQTNVVAPPSSWAGANYLDMVSASGISVGATVSGGGIPSGTTVTSISSPRVYLSQNYGTVAGGSQVTFTGVGSGVNAIPLVSTSGISVGATVSGVGIPSGTTVTSVAPNSVILSAATTSSTSSLSFTNNSYTPTKITVAGDTSAAKDALNDFVSKYNSVQDTIERYTKVTTSGSKVTSSILSGNRELSSIARTLRTELYKSSGLTGTVNRLADLGVTSSGIENTVSFNSSVLEAKLASASDDVNAFFKDAGTSAFMTRFKTNFLDKMITDAGSATGGLQAQLTSFTKQNTNLDKQIEEVERRLASQRSTLEASFIAMEKAQSRFQQQGSYLAKTFANQN